MKWRHIIAINLIFGGLMVFSASMVYQYMTGSQLLAAFSNFGHTQTSVHISTAACSSSPAIAGLNTTNNPYLQKLAVYQQACHSLATDTMMIFTGMPVSTAGAIADANGVSATLKEFATFHVRPLVIAEPTNYATGANLDFAQIASGAYNPWFDTYFKTLQTDGVSDTMMGIWDPFPEANLPYWDNNQSQYFAPCVNAYVSTLHRYFPTAQASIMLNAASYETTDFDWENGNYISLLPYIKGITPGSLTYIGLEGFPWVPPQGQTATPILNAATFLNASIISEAADYLHVKNIWLNTGTFSEKYALDPSSIAYLSPEQRASILTTIDGQALALKKAGYAVSVNLFSQDKTKASEQTNWSYWSNNSPFSSRATPVLTEFINQLNSQHIGFWLFDE